MNFIGWFFLVQLDFCILCVGRKCEFSSLAARFVFAPLECLPFLLNPWWSFWFADLFLFFRNDRQLRSILFIHTLPVQKPKVTFSVSCFLKVPCSFYPQAQGQLSFRYSFPGWCNMYSIRKVRAQEWVHSAGKWAFHSLSCWPRLDRTECTRWMEGRGQ